MMDRRHFLQQLGAGALAAAWPARASETSQRAPFRLLYDNDTTNLTSCVSPFHREREPFRPEMLEASVDEVTRAGVDAHLLQPGVGWVPMWPTKLFSLEEHYAWIKERYGRDPDPFGQFVLAGGDIVKTFIDRCRLRGQAALISVRLNDAHNKESADPKAGVKAGPSIGMSVTRFYVEHPEYRIKPGSLRSNDVVLNWAIPEVRARAFAIVRELCENYDLDGIELDFLRFYSYFREEETPVAERYAIMTGFVREVRALLDRTTRGGRHRWLGVRIPAYLASLPLLGIDVPAFVAAGVEMVNASAHYFTTQQQDLAPLRQQAGDAKLYFELCHSIWNGPHVGAGYDAFLFRRASAEELTTTAHLGYARGVDGISLFNMAYYRQHGGPGRGTFEEPPFDLFAKLKDPAWLARQPQHWFIAPGWRAPGMKPTPVPHDLAPGAKPARFAFDLAPPAGGWKGEARLRIQGEASLAGQDWQARFNGEGLAANADVSEPFPGANPGLLGKPEEMRAWTVSAHLLRPGANALEVSFQGASKARLVYLDLAIS